MRRAQFEQLDAAQPAIAATWTAMRAL